MKNSFFRLRVRPWGILTAAGFIAALGTCATFFGRFSWVLDLGAHFRVQYVVVFALLAVCYAAFRRWLWALITAVFLVVNLVPVVSLLYPRAPVQ